jgi:hypothetical protein
LALCEACRSNQQNRSLFLALPSSLWILDGPIPLCSLTLYASECFVATVSEEVPTMEPMFGLHSRTRQDEV